VNFFHCELLPAGESYAGIYVPMLAREVVGGNQKGARPRINIRGAAVCHQESPGQQRPLPRLVFSLCDASGYLITSNDH